MKKNTYWWQSWARFALWSHVIGVIGFYAIIWWRTSPRKEDRLRVLPPLQQKKIDPAISQEPAATEPFVSIIVPARNEERNILRCVQSLLEQDYANYEVIVVDDGSTDRTGEILDGLAHSHPNGKSLWVLRLRDELPAGWAGKPHAIHSGVQEARGDWFLFTDADTWHAPNALRSAIHQALAEQADLFTLGAEQELPSFWDRVLMPMAYLGISMLYPPRFVNDPQSPLAVANGQYILIRRQVYEDLGGYGRLGMRDTLLDDRDLAHLVKSHHYKLLFIDSVGLVHVHMYHSLADIWRGWRKNAYLGNRGGLLFALTQLFGLPMISIIPFLLPLLARLTRIRRSTGITKREAALATGLELVPLISYRAWLNRQLNVPWYYAFTHPLAGAIFEGILGQSMWRVLTKRGVDWRGRSYHNQNAPRVPGQADAARPVH
ncbi:glycosyltransferase [Dictyobacter kobayashii]|uniref:Glycosyl hydrolase n=1 Tax=Dictyobacter kobayashii TaxID=2014872 RepID=A0A402AFY9_9CHLR|nr:glycosyltransferase [Dictyobacter kobayashii]GCE18038.1 glycosyl hydrolase [Dictyobacter kobayashii]